MSEAIRYEADESIVVITIDRGRLARYASGDRRRQRGERADA
jgi:hypothetical protein